MSTVTLAEVRRAAATAFNAGVAGQSYEGLIPSAHDTGVHCAQYAPSNSSFLGAFLPTVVQAANDGFQDGSTGFPPNEDGGQRGVPSTLSVPDMLWQDLHTVYLEGYQAGVASRSTNWKPWAIGGAVAVAVIGGIVYVGSKKAHQNPDDFYDRHLTKEQLKRAAQIYISHPGGNRASLQKEAAIVFSSPGTIRQLLNRARDHGLRSDTVLRNIENSAAGAMKPSKMPSGTPGLLVARNPSFASNFSGKFALRREKLDQGGYTSRGQYFGVGAPLFRYSGEGLENGTEVYIDDYIRARDHKDAKAKIQATYPLASFYR